MRVPMKRIITTYLATEILKSCAAIVLVLFIILMSNALGRVLADIADGETPQLALWPVMLSQSVNTLSLLLPIGVFLGIVFAFGRLYKDHEIVVMNACGIGYVDFYKPVLIVVLPILTLSAYSSLSLNAQMQHWAQMIVDQYEESYEFSQVKPGQFNQSDNGDHVFYIESMSADQLRLHNVIISETGQANMIFETADSGKQKIDEISGGLFLVVGPGQRYEGQAGDNGYRLIDFEQHGILIAQKQQNTRKPIDSRQKSLSELQQSSILTDKVELHWRIAIPLVLLTLAVLAVPLSYIAPRQGRYGKVGYALLVFIVYLNLMGVAKAQLEAGIIPIELNFWWVHLLFIGLTLWLLYRHNRGFSVARAS